MGKLSKRGKRKGQLKKKEEAQERLKQQVGLFSLRPDSCSFCAAPFDNDSKEAAMTWRVIVKTEAQKVVLYCPECSNKIEDGINKVFGEADE